MSSSIQSWKDMQTTASDAILMAVPNLDKAHPRFFQAMRDMLAFSETSLATETSPNQLCARLIVKPRLSPARPLRALIDGLLTNLACAYQVVHETPTIFDAGRWADKQGFMSVVIALVKKGVPHEQIQALAKLLSGGISRYMSREKCLGQDHFIALFRRDHPDLGTPQNPSAAHTWLLACEYSGKPERPQILQRRRQALSLYFSIRRIIMEPTITAVIDSGASLPAALQTRLSLAPAELRRLQNACAFQPGLFSDDYTKAVVHLKDHGIPVTQWPLPLTWEGSPWHNFDRNSLLPGNYFDIGATVQDAVRSLKNDLMIPLAQERMRTLKLQHTYPVRTFLGNLSFPMLLTPSPDRHTFLTGIRRAIIGQRGPKAFEDAARIWHRKAASISAFRHERTVDKPGWPALCPPWRSPDSRFYIVPLTSAAELIAEGIAVDHCVGSYYPECRSGLEQILSLSRDGKRTATIELLLTYDDDKLSIKLGQFKAYHNRTPAPDLSAILHSFMRDINEGRHPVDIAAMVTHRQAMKKTGDYGCGKDVDVDFSRGIFALHRPLLPRDAGETFDAWCENTGLIATIDAALKHLAGEVGELHTYYY